MSQVTLRKVDVSTSYLRRARFAPNLRKALPQSWRDLEQIKFLLGHLSIQTTERYLGSEQEIAVAVNGGLAGSTAAGGNAA